MGNTNSSTKQSSEQPSCCNPKLAIPQSSKRVHFPPSPNPYASNGQRRRSKDSSPHESGQAEKPCQQQLGEYLGSLNIGCCCSNHPVSNAISDGRVNRRQTSYDEILAELNGQDRQAKKKTSWEKDPPPMDGWTTDEQQTLINELSKSPRDSRRYPEHREMVFTNLIRPNKPLEGRKVSECEQCYEHVQANRIVYFGPIQHHRTRQRDDSPAAARPQR